MMRVILIILALVAPVALFPTKTTSQQPSVRKVLSDLEKGPTLGNHNAPVAIVEFSDFQCSFCKKFWADILPQLKETYIEKGQAQFIYRHFSILGKHSVEAAKGAECAGEAGKFWEYHDKLFRNQGGLAFTQTKLKQYAKEVGLKAHPFSQCLASDKYLKKIEGETSVAALLGARGTPTFFINERLLVGAQPFEVFRKVIEEEIKKNAKKK
jgi:protein-disulfide isomerase